MVKLQIWRDRRGQISPLRIAALALLLLPLALAAWNAEAIAAGARPVNDLIHRAGFWALMLLLITLAITPLRRISRFGQLVDIRRMLGVGAFCYAALHISLYVVDQVFDLGKVASEIVHRVYLMIGFTALTGLAVLAMTSTDGMVRRLGGSRWQSLHQIVYVIGFLALIHYFQQTKADVTVPTFAAGLFLWLFAYRLVAWWQEASELSTVTLIVMSVAVSVLTFVGEAVGIGIAYHVSPMRVLEVAFDFDLAVRPGWRVLGAGLVVVAIDFACARWQGRPLRMRTAAAE